jgi:hypothetical protein
MNHPKRLQRPRRRGYRTPPGVIYVGRPTIWGNPFQGRAGHCEAVKLHSFWLAGELGALTLERLRFSPGEIDALTRLRQRVLSRVHELAGRDLQCWCPTTALCHADALLMRLTALSRTEACDANRA